MGNVYSVQIPVRFRDLDAMGHVNNAVFFTYFEIGRETFHSENISSKIEKSLSSFILAHISCDYMRPVTVDTRLTLSMAVKKIGRKSFEYLYILSDTVDESVEYARGESVQVCYDYERNKSVDLSPEFRDILINYQV